MRASLLVMAGLMLAGSVSFAERAGNVWKEKEKVEGQAKLLVDGAGRKFCTHEGTRFAHSMDNSTLVVVDKESGKSAKYLHNVGFSRPGFTVLVKMETGDASMPNYIGTTDDSTYYFDKLSNVQGGLEDKGFYFGSVATPYNKTYTLLCSKK
ncbi:hypothetical protein EZJ49_10420 [Bdellovibrio bacteriovorus]|uniref:hypothetical protein n=1 Tax=Bdellovibrio bacteriovorus TaxID=959 RepID=UPI0021D0482E|nr:hypothetical protein [Bdellovibrio bacteriovorus]UXR63488.1 hypothetical protein EZJ49_10420 [Bdellovibrio bacteriovorus]